MNANESFGEWLRQRRKALDLTQAELACQIGCATTTIRKFESGVRRPSKQISERMADILAISLDDRANFLAFARRVTNSATPALDLNGLTSTSNLPLQSTPFIGREDELAHIADRLHDPTCRLLTLVGAGGIGKTRLALQAAADQIDKFSDGVYFISLTPIGSTTFIASAIANALDFSFHGQDDPDTQIVNYLRSKHILLVMDNYEHLLGGVTLLAEILANVPRLKLLVTSRERLNMQEEWILPVEGLPFSAAVELFAQTARRLQPGFSLDANQAGVADICRTVEGLPLGIELAASWLRTMPCQQIAEQIKRDLDFLATPLRNVPERHRSLRAVFEHSWGLLSEIERSVLMKLSVFRGGIDAEAAEQIVCASLALLAGLVDKSLVRLNAAGRYEMHELLRQFAADKLTESDETAETQRRHFQFFLGLAEQLDRWFFGPQHLVWMDRIETEHDNFRAALDWASQVGDAESGLRLAGALGWFWNRRTYWNEGHEWLGIFLAAGRNTSPEIRAKALHHALVIDMEFHDNRDISALLGEALILAREVEDQRTRAWLLSSVGFVGDPDFTDCERYLEQALALFRELEDHWGICQTLSRLAQKLFQRGDFTHAAELQEEGIRLARQAGAKSVLCWSALLSACRNWYQGNTDLRTESMYLESLALFRELRYKYGILLALCHLGKFARLRGDDERARALFEQSLTLAQQVGQKSYMTVSLIGLAEIFERSDDPQRGAQIIGAVSDIIQTWMYGPSLGAQEDRRDYERTLAAARAQLGESAFAAAFAEGQRMTLDEAVAYAWSDSVHIVTE